MSSSCIALLYYNFKFYTGDHLVLQVHFRKQDKYFIYFRVIASYVINCFEGFIIFLSFNTKLFLAFGRYVTLYFLSIFPIGLKRYPLILQFVFIYWVNHYSGQLFQLYLFSLYYHEWGNRF